MSSIAKLAVAAVEAVEHNQGIAMKEVKGVQDCEGLSMKAEGV